jgi:hypothetical protein
MKKTIAPFLFSLLVTSALVAQRDSTYKVRLDTLRVQSLSQPTSEPWYRSSAALAYGALIVSVGSVLVSLYVSSKTWKKNAELSARQANSKLYADNRQEWVNKVRDCLSNLLTACGQLNISFQQKSVENDYPLHEKVSLYRNQLRLYLNPQIAAHAAVLEELRLLIGQLDRHLLNRDRVDEPFGNVGFMELSDRVINSGRDMLYKEWGKIQAYQDKYFL